MAGFSHNEYRVVRVPHPQPNGEVVFMWGIHEISYDLGGNILSWDSEPEPAMDATLEYLVEEISLFQEALRKPPLEFDPQWEAGLCEGPLPNSMFSGYCRTETISNSQK